MPFALPPCALTGCPLFLQDERTGEVLFVMFEAD